MSCIRNVQDESKRNLTSLTNKITRGNHERIIAELYDHIHVENEHDANQIVRSLYHRAITDGHGGCYHEVYAKVLKALHQGYPDLFQSKQFPVTWHDFACLVDSLMVQQESNFMEFVDAKQRWRLIAIAILQLLAHLSMTGLWSIKAFINDLFFPHHRFILQASCRKGKLLDRLVSPYYADAVDLETSAECICTLLQVVGGHGFHSLQDQVVLYLDDLLWRPAKDQALLGTRIRVLIEGLLNQNWARECRILQHDIPKLSADMERRVDPQDGKAYTLLELLKYYGNVYTEREIKLYFVLECATFSKSKAPHEAKSYKRQHWHHRQG